MTPEAKAETIWIIKILAVALGCIIGMMYASLWFMPVAFDAYENEVISLDVYYMIWSLPIVTIGIVLIGTGLYMYKSGKDDDARKQSLRPKESE